ncbi:MAG: kelch repeat-containing protein [Phycisphaerae bacterium]|nr:kelch repeat-containing protein [Phycisphaerae bacterium]
MSRLIPFLLVTAFIALCATGACPPSDSSDNGNANSEPPNENAPPDNPPDEPGFVVRKRLVTTAGGKRAVQERWYWDGEDWEFISRVPISGPNQGLGADSKAAATSTGRARGSRGQANLPTDAALFCGGVSSVTGEFATAQAYYYTLEDDGWVGLTMTTPRTGHTTTTLLDGRILIVGGWDGRVPIAFQATAEIFDPKTLTFTPTGSMSIARSGHAAARLADGRVLVSGGNEALLPSAELYDPATGQFSPTGSMTEYRSDHEAVTLDDGRVLIIGSNNTLNAEVYDATSGAFTAIADMNGFHGFGSSATKLTNGKVLIIGGFGDILSNANSIGGVELFDPATNSFALLAPMARPRRNHLAVLQSDGTVLVGGGILENGDTTGTVEIFNPQTNTFAAGPDMPRGGTDHSGVQLSLD